MNICTLPPGALEAVFERHGPREQVAELTKRFYTGQLSLVDYVYTLGKAYDTVGLALRADIDRLIDEVRDDGR